MRLVWADGDKNKSRDSESAMVLDFPGIYVGYNVV